MKTFDAIVIGAGPGGYPCGIRLGQLKQKTLVLEKDQPGGVCLNWGCIPSKALISTAHLYEKTKNGAVMGIKATVELDPGAMQDWKDGIVKRLTGGVRTLLRANGAELMGGTATITGPKTVSVETPDGRRWRRSEATKGIVIATGASTIELPSFKFDPPRIIGAKEAVSLRQVPKRLLVIGGGIIGLELGMVYQKLGSALTVVEALPDVLTGVDAECAKVVERRLEKLGGKIYKKAKALGHETQTDGSVLVKIEVDGKTESIACDTVLVAVGMRPASKGLGLDKVGVHVDPRGFIPTDRQGRTNIPFPSTPSATISGPRSCGPQGHEGRAEIVAEVIAGLKSEKDWVTIPGAIFTDPEIATAGITADEAKARGLDVIVGKFPFAALGKAMAIAETEGFVKIVADKKTKQVLGVHIVGPEASTMISEAALGLEMAAFVEDFALTIHPHPTLGEAVMEAAAATLGHAIHIANR